MCISACADGMIRSDGCHMESTTDESNRRDSEQQIEQLKSDIDSLRQQLTERDCRITTLEDSRLHLEKQLSSQAAEISVSICHSRLVSLLSLHSCWFVLELYAVGGKSTKLCSNCFVTVRFFLFAFGHYSLHMHSLQLFVV